MTRTTSNGFFRRRLRSRLWQGCFGGLLLASTAAGCSRQFWRKQADMDVYDATAQKITDMRWAVPRIDVTPDPRSRFYDPYDPDRPPLPPDDPSAHVFMHWVDGWQGYKGWHQFGDLMSVENPQWLAPFGITPDMIDPGTGQYVGQLPQIKDLTLQQAVELAQIQNRDYQTQIENVYLSALNVTFERFQFGVRYLGFFGEPGAAIATRMTPDGDDFNDGATGTANFGISQALPTGAQWIVELSNSTLWLFSGGNQTSTASTLSYSLTQPIWFGAGRKVVLEGLTLTERQLLYAVRDLARFRQQLFTDIVASGQSTSFLALLQARQLIINQEENIRRLQQQAFKLTANASRGQETPSVPILDANNEATPLPAGIVIPPELDGLLTYDEEDRRLRWRPATQMTLEQAAQIRAMSQDPFFLEAAENLIRQVRVPVADLSVLQILTQYNTAVNQLRTQERNFQDNLDAYKIALGLPPTIPMTLDTTLLNQFALIDPEVTRLEQMADIGFSETWATSAPTIQIPDAPDGPSEVFDQEAIRTVSAAFSALVREVRLGALERVRREMEAVRTLIPHRMAELLDDEKQRLQIDFERDQRIFAELESDFQVFEEEVNLLESDLAAPRIDQDQLQRLRQRIKDAQEQLVRFVRNLTVLEVGLRVEMIELNPFDMTEEECLATALANRVDLMNAKAQVMDARRQVEVAANALQAALNLVAEGDFGTTNDVNPFAFNGDASTIRFGVEFKAPLDQISERNNYRAALINYQQEKRSYMLFEDTVKQQVRRALRGITVQKRNIETSRGAIRRAAQQYDAQNEQTDDPARGAQQANAAAAAGGGGGQSGQTGLQVLNSLNAILQAQNQLISTWVDYERNRLNIYRDMGTMVIGPDGLWDDPYYRASSDERRTPDLQIDVPPPPAPDDPADLDGGSGLGGGVPPQLDAVVPAEEN